VSIPRWLIMANSTDATVLVAAQVLHGVGFGAFWLAGVQRMSRGARPAIAASAQSLWAAGTYGIGALVGAGLAGWARAELGSAGIFTMLAVVSVLASFAALWLVIVDGRRGASPA
jgi:PPP family 3-phenylpropionic acid transporter